MFKSVVEKILELHGPAALFIVFLMPFLESGALVGFIFPGELAVLLGGVLAQQGKVPVVGVLLAAIVGAILGDSVGYEMGKRYGHKIIYGTLGRFIKHEHLQKSENYLATKGGKAVFFGRFTAALRVLIPGLAGMSGMPRNTFTKYNASGGIIWSCIFVAIGYIAGESWKKVEHYIGLGGTVSAAAVVVIGFISFKVVQKRNEKKPAL
jgi:membrane protein DedA with SNARE-associated domain